MVARGEAALGHGDATRRALEKLARESPPPPLFFDETTELWPYAAQDWYVVLALKAWKHGGGFSFDDYVSAMVRHAGETLVSLDVASAEAKEPTGTWALWTGATQEGRLDRDGHSTVLRAEGLDVHDEVTAEDRLVSMQTTQGPFTRYGYVSTPIYQTELVHREVLSRSGRAFFVRYPEATERLVAMHRFTAFGRYSGREDGVPVLEAVAVFDRDRK